MIPRWPLVWLAAALLLAGLLAAFVPAIAAAWPILAGVAVAVALLDAAFVVRARPPQVERETPGSMSLSSWSTVRLTITNPPGQRPVFVEVYDHHPEHVDVDGLPQRVSVPSGRFADFEYRVRPTQRGTQRYLRTELRIASPFGLWWRRRIVDVESEVHTYPNYSRISKLLAYEVDNRLPLAGVRQSRRRGEGIEFHQLRDYRDGDSLRAIDWKATARMSRLISREYQDERDQQVVFLLDAGRRMLAKDDELSHFDHTLNAMLLVAYIALRQGDATGVMAVGSERHWLPPRKGMATINGLLNHVFDVQPEPVEIDLVSAATELAFRQRRRSLIIILTNVREEDSDDLLTATSFLMRKHLVILASLRERALDDSLAHPVHSFDDALLYAATNQYVDARRDSQNLLRARGVFVEDCLSDELPAAIANRYLAIKRSGML